MESRIHNARGLMLRTFGTLNGEPYFGARYATYPGWLTDERRFMRRSLIFAFCFPMTSLYLMSESL